MKIEEQETGDEKKRVRLHEGTKGCQLMDNVRETGGGAVMQGIIPLGIEYQ